MPAIFGGMSSIALVPAARREYQQLRRRLGKLEYISQGSVQDRTFRKGGGAGYQWTRKVARKTVSVALTPEQFHLLEKATTNYRELRKILKRMETLSRTILFDEAPHKARHKRLSSKVLGTM
jgi:hypothetical protein